MNETKHSAEAYPLSWPVGWPRTRSPSRSRFYTVTLYKARSEMENEMRLLGATGLVLSTNIPLRQDGLPYSNSREPQDHGAAVYFRIKGQPRVLAVDKWDLVAHNIIAITRHVEAMRGQLRWGVGTLEQAFGGYLALEAAPAGKSWWEILGVNYTASLEVIENSWRELLRANHPDRGGDHARAAEINAAFTEAKKERGNHV